MLGLKTFSRVITRRIYSGTKFQTSSKPLYVRNYSNDLMDKQTKRNKKIRNKKKVVYLKQKKSTNLYDAINENSILSFLIIIILIVNIRIIFVKYYEMKYSSDINNKNKLVGDAYKNNEETN